jgi:hypothetical protein
MLQTWLIRIQLQSSVIKELNQLLFQPKLDKISINSIDNSNLNICRINK